MVNKKLTHLKQLEIESIHILREVATEFDNPIMMYSVDHWGSGDANQNTV